MRYSNIVEAKFIDRPNRFISHCEVNGEIETVHVKNTGRCKELLVEGCTVYLEKSDNPSRKTKYDLISVYKGDTLINMDSQAPNKVAFEWLREGGYVKNPTLVKPETTYKNSRFDFYIETKDEKCFVEVKGVTLEKDGVAMFPDAPTDRGAKHINELIDAKKNGYKAAILFVIQMKGCNLFIPNSDTDPKFSFVLKEAHKFGVDILVMDCNVTKDSLVIDKPVTFEI